MCRLTAFESDERDERDDEDDALVDLTEDEHQVEDQVEDQDEDQDGDQDGVVMDVEMDVVTDFDILADVAMNECGPQQDASKLIFNVSYIYKHDDRKLDNRWVDLSYRIQGTLVAADEPRKSLHRHG